MEDGHDLNDGGGSHVVSPRVRFVRPSCFFALLIRLMPGREAACTRRLP